MLSFLKVLAVICLPLDRRAFPNWGMDYELIEINNCPEKMKSGRAT